MSSGFSFGAKPAAAAPSLTTPSFSFGNAAGQPPQATTLSFTTQPSQVPTLSFGTPTAPASTPATTGSLFSIPTPGGGLFGSTLGTATSTMPSLSFGGATANTIAPTPAMGTTAGGFSLGAAPAAATKAPTFGLGSAQPTIATSAPATSLSFGFGLSAPASTALPPSSTAVTTSASVGLGGIASSSQSKVAVTTQKEIPPKEQQLPNEILQTVEQLKDFVKQQKGYSSDIARCSIRDFRRVEQEIDQLSSKLNEVEKWLVKNRQIAEKLKFDTARTVQNVEMAQRTHDTPPGLQYENTAPLKFFFNLADQFENEMQNLKVQIEAVEKFVKSHKNPDPLTPQDLALGMRRLHETFVALAGRLQSVHSQVESQKETYLNIRKHLLHDSSNPFEKLAKASAYQMSTAFKPSPPKVATGPTPFNAITLSNMTSAAAQPLSGQPPAYPGLSTSTATTGFGSSGFGLPMATSQPSNTSLFGTTGFGQTSSLNTSFQLQKPPTGNKRGKI